MSPARTEAKVFTVLGMVSGGRRVWVTRDDRSGELLRDGWGVAKWSTPEAAEAFGERQSVPEAVVDGTYVLVDEATGAVYGRFVVTDIDADGTAWVDDLDEQGAGFVTRDGWVRNVRSATYVEAA